MKLPDDEVEEAETLGNKVGKLIVRVKDLQERLSALPPQYDENQRHLQDALDALREARVNLNLTVYPAKDVADYVKTKNRQNEN